jgi:hypothetical protein
MRPFPTLGETLIERHSNSGLSSIHIAPYIGCLCFSMSTRPNQKDDDNDEDEDDYMSMIIEEPKATETFAQRKLRKQREVITQPLHPYTHTHTYTPPNLLLPR